MAKKQLNRKLVVLLLLIGLPILAIFLIAVDYKYPFLPEFIHQAMGNDPIVLKEKSEDLVEQIESREKELMAEAGTVPDVKERYEKIRAFHDGDWTNGWREIFKTIDQALKYSKGKDVGKELRKRKAELLTRIYNFPAAIKVWTDITQRYPDEIEARRSILSIEYKMAAYYRKPAKWLDIQKQANQFIERAPSDGYGYLVLADSQIQLLAMNATENQESTRNAAEAALVKAGEVNENDPLLWKLRGALEMVNARDKSQEEQSSYYEKAEAAYREGLTRNPEDPEPQFNLIRDYYIVRYDSMRESQNQGASPNVNTANLEGWRDQTVREIDAAIDRFPKDGRFYVLKAEFLLSEIKKPDDFEPVFELYREGLALEPSELLWKAALGQLYISRAEWISKPEEDFQVARDLLREGYYRSLWPDSGSLDAVSWSGIRSGLVLPILIETDIDLSMLTQDKSQQEAYLKEARELSIALREAVGDKAPSYRAAEAIISLAVKDYDKGIRELYQVCKELELTEGVERNRKLQRLYYRLALGLARDGQTSVALTMARKSDLSRRGGYGFKTLFDTLIDIKGSTNQAILLAFITEYYEKSHTADDPYYQDMMVYKARLLLDIPGRREEAGTLIRLLTGSNRQIDLLKAQALTEESEREKAFVALAEKYPGDIDILQNLADYYFLNKDYARSSEYIERALKADPGNLQLLIKARTLKVADPAKINPDEQEAIYLQAVNAIQDPKERIRLQAIYYHDRAVKLSGDENILNEKAKEVWVLSDKAYAELSRLEPESLEGIKGQFYAAIALKDWTKAESLIARVEKKDDYTGRRLRADYQLGKAEWAEALISLEKLIDLKPTDLDERFKAANANYQLNNFSEAEKQLRELLALDPFYIRANLMQASLLERQYVQAGAALTLPQVQEILQLAGHILDVAPTHATGNSIYIHYGTRLIELLHQEAQSPLISANTKALYTQRIDNIHRDIVARGQYLVNTYPDRMIYWQSFLQHYLSYLKLEDPIQESVVKETEKIFQQALAKQSNAPQIIALYEQFKAMQGESGQGEMILKDLIDRSEGEAKSQAMMNLARLYLTNGKDPAAIDQLEQIITDDPGNAEAVIQLGPLYLKRGEIERARRIYQVAQQHNNSPMLAIGEIDALLAARDVNQAMAVLQKLETAPEYQANRSDFRKEILLQKIRIAMMQVRYEDAIKMADEVLALESNQAMAWRLKCEALFNSNQMDAAEAAAKKMAMVAPSQTVTSNYILARIYLTRGLTAQAISLLKDNLNQDPNHTLSQYLLTQTLTHLERWSELETFYNTQMEKNPNRIDFKVAMGNFYLDRALAEDARIATLTDELDKQEAIRSAQLNFRRSIDVLQKAYQASSENSSARMMVLDVLIKALVATDNFDNAKTLLNNILKDHPDNLKCQLYLVEVLGRSQQSAEALELVTNLLNRTDLSELDRILILGQVGKAAEPAALLAWAEELSQQQPDRPEWHWIQAIVYNHQGEYQKENDQWMQALKHADKMMRQEILSQAGNSSMLISNYRQASDYYRQLKESLPKDRASAEVLNNLAYALLNMDTHLDEALTLARQAYYLRQDSDQVVDTYSLALIKTGDFVTARKLLLQIVRDNQAMGTAFPIDYEYHLAQAYQGEGNATEALVQVESALNRLDKATVGVARSAWQEKLQKLKTELSSN